MVNCYNFKTNFEAFENDFLDIVRAFSLTVKYDPTAEKRITLNVSLEEKKVTVYCKIDEIDDGFSSYEYMLDDDSTELLKKKYLKRYSKLALYRHISSSFNVKLPYGALTGIRPTKLFYELSESGKERDLIELLGVTQEKFELINNIAQSQKGVYNRDTDMADVFINIPFCPTRCSYCSFICETIKHAARFLDDYVTCLIEDVSQTLDYLKSKNVAIRSVYVGGGTPTSLSVDKLESILALFSGYNIKEFTVEAGRPDTVYSEMLDMLKKVGVNRISINPQSFNDKTLELIGRKHTVADTYRAFELASSYGFVINMDLIAMLPQESLSDFCFSVDSAIKLAPNNLTVHTLALKKGSELKESGYDNSDALLANGMVDYAYKALLSNGYSPYYMYRQKYMSGNLENVGYTKSGFQSIYNIDIMEETHNIIASGAGAISKGLFGENRIERFAMPKNIRLYIERHGELMENKEDYMKKILFKS